jgi:subtilisin family serine protease
MAMFGTRLAFLLSVTAAVFVGALQPNSPGRAALAGRALPGAGRFQRAKPYSMTRSAARSPRPQAAGTVEAIVTLRDEPVAAMLKFSGPAGPRPGQIDLESDQARSYGQQLESRQAEFISHATEAVPDLRVKGQLRVLANAISVDLRPSEMPLISGLPGVQSVEIARTCHALLNRSLPLISAPAMWTRLGGPATAGTGMKIAIVDTGIDISSRLVSDQGLTAPPGFPRGNTLFTNNKVIVAKAFLSDASSTPADEFGHGTSVAGVAAGSLNTATIVGLISGVAPRAYLGNYRVLDAEGKGSEFQVAAGLEEALKDGFDVANISLGSQSIGRLSLLGNAVEKAVAAGMIVVAAAGNQGADGKQTIDSPAEAPSAIAVGASGNDHSVTSGLIVAGPAPLPDNIGRESGTIACCGDLSGVIGPLPCVDVSSTDPAHDGCNGLAAGSLSGRIALLQNSLGDCLMVQKLNAARAAGAAGAVVFSLDSTLGTSPSDLAPAGLPSILIGTGDGRALRSWVRQHPEAPVSISPAVEFPDASQSDVWQSFSGLGPSGLGQLKPDIAAPGANIFTASVAAGLGFELLSGTSFASPHIAGAAALVKQLHPSWTPDQIKSALMSSADTVFATSRKTDTAGALAAGAGRVDLDRAGSVTATFLPASLSFGFKRLKPKSAITPAVADFKITNVTSATAFYSISGSPDDTSLSIAVSDNSITLAPGQSAMVTVTIVVLGRKAANNQDHTGSLVIQGPAGQTMHIPYWVRFGDVKGSSS